MGWSGANDIYTGVVDALIGEGLTDEARTRVAVALINALEDHDWDTQDEVVSGLTDPDWLVAAWRQADPTVLDPRDRLTPVKEVAHLPEKERGLYGKFEVEAVDGHVVDWCFVLEDTDGLARPAMRVYADAAEKDGKLETASAARALALRTPSRRGERAADQNGWSAVGYYKVSRHDGKPVRECLVLEDVDPYLIEALRAYADIARSAGYARLADDLAVTLVGMGE